MHHPIVYYEQRKHGTREFPAEYYFVDHSHPRYVMSFHWHTEWELIQVREGRFHLRADEEEYSLGRGDVALLRDGMLHGGTPDRCVYECYVFDLPGLFRNMEPVRQYLYPVYHMDVLPSVYFPAGEYPEVSGFARTLFDVCGARSGSEKYGELAQLGSLCSLFGHVLRNGLYTKTPGRPMGRSYRVEQIKTVLAFIEQNYSQPITLNDMAGLAGMNPRYFCRAFQQITQQTPMDYVIFYRIERASLLLVSSSQAVMDVALECGFNDHSYFSKSFKRLKGVTPSEYRKRYSQLQR